MEGSYSEPQRSAKSLRVFQKSFIGRRRVIRVNTVIQTTDFGEEYDTWKKTVIWLGLRKHKSQEEVARMRELQDLINTENKRIGAIQTKDTRDTLVREVEVYNRRSHRS